MLHLHSLCKSTSSLCNNKGIQRKGFYFVTRSKLLHMGVSLNGGTPISHPKCWSFLVGNPMIGKHPYQGNTSKQIMPRFQILKNPHLRFSGEVKGRLGFEASQRWPLASGFHKHSWLENPHLSIGNTSSKGSIFHCHVSLPEANPPLVFGRPLKPHNGILLRTAWTGTFGLFGVRAR